MSCSVCETYPALCSRYRLANPPPARLFHPANDNLPKAATPPPITLAVPIASSDGDPMSAIEITSVISMLGLIALAVHTEITAAAPVFAAALDRFLEGGSTSW